MTEVKGVEVAEEKGAEMAEEKEIEMAEERAVEMAEEKAVEMAKEKKLEDIPSQQFLKRPVREPTNLTVAKKRKECRKEVKGNRCCR